MGETTDNALSFYFICVPEDDARCQAAFNIKQISPVISLFIGTIGNVLNIIVLSRKKFRKHPFLIGFLVRSVSDTIQLLLHFLSIYLIRKLDSQNMYKYCKYGALAVLSQGTFSLYVLAILAVERTLYVRYSHVHGRIVSKRNYVILLCIVMSSLVLFHTFMVFGGTEDVAMLQNSSDAFCNTSEVAKDRFECIVVSHNHGAYRPFMMPILSFVDNVTPFFIICVGNVLTIKSIRDSRARVIGSGGMSNLTQDTATRIATATCIFFFVCTSPLYISKTVQSIVGIPTEVYPLVSLIDMILYIGIQSNFAFNFIMYFLAGTVFRDEFKAFVKGLFKCRRSMS